MPRLKINSIIVIAIGATLAAPASAADYYAGKTIEFVVGAGAAAAMISMRARWRAISGATFRAIRPWW